MTKPRPTCARCTAPTCAGRPYRKGWNKVGKAIASTYPDLGVTTWESIKVPRKYVYSKPEFHRLQEEPPALKTGDGKTLLIGEGQVLVYAPTRSFKSFIALRWANQLAQDGKTVLFCVGERFKSFAKRSRAHDSYYEDAPPDDLHFADVLALHLDGALIGWLNMDNKFDVVFVDTFRSVINPEDENSNSEIGGFLRGLREVAKLVVIIHHTNRGGEDFAGAGAFSTNTDSEISVKSVEGVKLLRSVDIGQNDDESEFDLHYRLVMHEGSLVAVEADARAVAGAKERATADTAEKKKHALDEKYFGILERGGEVTKVELADESGTGERSVHRWLQRAMKEGKVTEGRKAGRANTYTITNEGTDDFEF